MKNKSNNIYSFNNSAIKAIVTTVGKKTIKIEDEIPSLKLNTNEILKLKKTMGLKSRQIVGDNKTTIDLCEFSAKKIIKNTQIDPKDISGIILVTQSPDYSAPSSAIELAKRLNIPLNSFAFDISLGCSGFIYGLFLAMTLINAGSKKIILCVGDVASKLTNPKDKTLTPLMGDAGSAILIDKGNAYSYFDLYSDGSGQNALFIPNSGIKFNHIEKKMPKYMTMNGGEVFNFTLKQIPNLINEMLLKTNNSIEKIDYFVLHQPNLYLLNNIQKRLKIDDKKFPKKTQSKYGNQNSASIPGTINGFLNKVYSSKKIKSLFCGFGIGLSWGCCITETSKIYSPRVFKI